MRVTLTHHLLIVRDTDGHIGSVPSFHFKHVPSPFDFDGRHCSAVLGRQATIRRPEARFRLTTVVVKRVHYTSRSQLTEFPLVGATYERYVVVTNAERCKELKFFLLHRNFSFLISPQFSYFSTRRRRLGGRNNRCCPGHMCCLQLLKRDPRRPYSI